MRGLRPIPAAALALLVAGCQLGYYTQLVRGQMELLSRREPIERLLAAPGTDPALKPRLALALEARRFAARALALPDNDSYTEYSDLRRPYALWNVYAAPEFSLAPHQWCYLFMGCMAYRGYYDEAEARREARRLQEQGLDVAVSGVPAYSTLGWFDDPLLSTLLRYPDEQVAGTVFHELAHQRLFIDDDTAFNESFATFVEDEGLRRFLAGRPALARAAAARRGRQDRFIALVTATRARLDTLYASGRPHAELRAAKRVEIERLRAEYRSRRADWGPEYDAWFDGEINNARLLPFGLYFGWVDAFRALLAECGGAWPCFYREAERIGQMPAGGRAQRLAQLQKRAAASGAQEP